MKAFFTRLGIVARPFAGFKMPRALGGRVARWQAASAADPRLAVDIIDMGKILAYGDVDATDRLQASEMELAYDRGRRDFALDLLAMMHMTNYELNQLLKETHDEHSRTED